MKEDLYIHLIYKKLQSSLSPEEQRQLDDWLAQSADHPRIAKTVERAWQLGEGTEPEVTIDLDADFALLEKKILEDEKGGKEAKVRPLKSRTPWWQIAAAILLLLAFAFLTRNYLGGDASWNQLATTKGEQQSLTLADGSRIWINTNSTFEYPDKFEHQQRRVRLEGEAFFEIARDTSRPFLIETPAGEVRVLGTSFNVRDYGEEEQMSVGVLTGKVQFKSSTAESAIVLTAGESGILDKRSQELTKEAGSLNSAAWHTRELVFNETRMNEVITTVETFYDVNIEVEQAKLLNCTFSSSFRDQPLEVVLETINTVFESRSRQVAEDAFVLSGGNECNQ